MFNNQLSDLFFKYFNKTATKQERIDFMLYLKQTDKDEDFFLLMEEAYHKSSDTFQPFTPEMRDRMLKNILNAEPTVSVTIKPRKLYQPATRRIKVMITTAVAILLVSLGIGLYIGLHRHQHIQTKIANHVKDINPGGKRAILTLENGQKIVLDTASAGLLTEHQGVTVSVSAGGQLIYKVNASNTVSSNQSHTIETPKGGQYQINLPDGTKVWLNAESKLRFPVNFSPSERYVTLTGEAYFEVTKDKKRPFKVSLNKDQSIEVLGTRFNINAYPDKNQSKTTLLEGAVRVVSGSNKLNIRPGQQVNMDVRTLQTAIIEDADLVQTMAWKNDYFCNSSTIRLSELMEQINRWYDVKIQYEQPYDMELVATLPRNISLIELLNLIELTKKVKFDFDGKTIKVKKYAIK
ncbi:FecR domain-containing protein [Sphingobacterium spiritivorum]|uniref:FecR domain-containing protein n=1 Tax=Sphingobacterium spiritivorum TaxID=258 RepID=UPI003DA33B32